ncbi:MAG: RNA polymerase sigma factor [Ktedonobacterales bacterium]
MAPWRRGATLALLRAAVFGAHTAHLLQPGAGDASGAQSGPLAGATGEAQRARFEQWFSRYQLPLLDYLFGMTRDREWAADLVQETFLHAYTASGAHTAAIQYPQAWLYRIATNIALSALRRKNRFDWLPLATVEPESGAGSSDRWARPALTELHAQDFAASVAERDAVWGVLAELPPRWRAVLLLQTTAGFEVREIAGELHISEANVRKILFRAKERFRQIHARLEAADAAGGAR